MTLESFCDSVNTVESGQAVDVLIISKTIFRIVPHKDKDNKMNKPNNNETKPPSDERQVDIKTNSSNNTPIVEMQLWYRNQRLFNCATLSLRQGESRQEDVQYVDLQTPYILVSLHVCVHLFVECMFEFLKIHKHFDALC